MPERLNAAALLESVDEKSVRAELVTKIRSSLSKWIGPPIKLFFLGDHHSQASNWPNDEMLREQVLSSSEILFIYFAAVDRTQQIVLSIRNGSPGAIYTISFPSVTGVNDRSVVLEILLILYKEMSVMSARCVVTAGPELEIDSTSVESVVKSTEELGSLIEMVCLDEDDASGLIDFVAVGGGCGAVCLSREDMRRPKEV